MADIFQSLENHVMLAWHKKIVRAKNYENKIFSKKENMKKLKKD